VLSLLPKRGKTGPECFQSINPMFPVKLERSFSFSALEDNDEDLECDEEDEDDTNEMRMGMTLDVKRTKSNLLSPTILHYEEVQKGASNGIKEKQSPIIKQKVQDKENIEPEKGQRERKKSVKMDKNPIKENNEEYKNTEGKMKLDNKFHNEPSKAQE